MTLHTKLSYVKSAARLVGYVLLIQAALHGDWRVAEGLRSTYLLWAGMVLVASELIGIAEEAWPGAYKGTETDTKIGNGGATVK
jgi:hypothetical protein